MTMKSCRTLLLSLLAAMIASQASASVFLPRSMQAKEGRTLLSKRSANNNGINQLEGNHGLRWALRQQQRSSSKAAMAIPGYGVAEQVFVGGFANFLNIYNIIITARILLSWFPQAQGVAALQPLYTITDPFLNLFRGLIPPVFGLDLSPILAFLLLNVLTNATAAVGYEMTPEMQRKYIKTKGPGRFYFPSRPIPPHQYKYVEL